MQRRCWGGENPFGAGGGPLTCLTFSPGAVQPRARIHEVTDGEQPAAAVTGAEHSVLQAQGTELAHSAAGGCIRPPAWPPQETATLWGAATSPTAPIELSEQWGLCPERMWHGPASLLGIPYLCMDFCRGRGGVYGYGGVHTLGGSAWHCVHGICTHGRRFSCIGGLCTHLRVCMHGAVRAFGVRAGGGLENTERL